jgi:hypothetical protein
MKRSRMIYATVYKPSQWKTSLQIITGIRRISENLNKEYSVCQTGNPGAILFPTPGLSIYGLISIPFLKVKRISSQLYTVAYSTRLYQSSSLNSVSGPSLFSSSVRNRSASSSDVS